MKQIIKKLLVTEKGTRLKESANQYLFEVDRNANKTHIKQAVEKIFDVKVLSVNTMNRRGKVKRRGLIEGKRPDTKRAIVTVAPGDRIELFDAGL